MNDDMNFNEVEDEAKETDDFTEVVYSAGGEEPAAEKTGKKKTGSIALFVGMVIILVAAIILTTLLVLISIKKKNGSIPSDASITESFSLLFKGEEKKSSADEAPDKKMDSASEKKEIVINPEVEENKSGEADTSASDGTSSDSASDAGNQGTDAADSENSYEPKPEFKVTTTLGQYKGIEVDYVVETVSEDDIEDEIQSFLEENAVSNEITDRPAQLDDVVVFSCTGTVGNEINDNCALDDYELTLGSGSMIPGFEEGFVGHSAGESFQLPLTFPEDYYEDMAGKDVVFDITLTSISEMVIPELTDELVAENTDYATVEEYRNSIREDFEQDAIHEADDAASYEVVNRVIENASFDGELQDEIDWTTEDTLAYYDQMANSYYGISGAELYSAMYGMDEANYRAMIAEQSTQQVKFQHILEQIIAEEGLTCSDEEYNETFEAVFYDQYGFTTPEEVYQNISEEDAKTYITQSVLNEKAQNLIIDSAVYNGK